MYVLLPMPFLFFGPAVMPGSLDILSEPNELRSIHMFPFQFPFFCSRCVNAGSSVQVASVVLWHGIVNPRCVIVGFWSVLSDGLILHDFSLGSQLQEALRSLPYYSMPKSSMRSPWVLPLQLSSLWWPPSYSSRLLFTWINVLPFSFNKILWLHRILVLNLCNPIFKIVTSTN